MSVPAVYGMERTNDKLAFGIDTQLKIGKMRVCIRILPTGTPTYPPFYPRPFVETYAVGMPAV